MFRLQQRLPKAFLLSFCLHFLIILSFFQKRAAKLEVIINSNSVPVYFMDGNLSQKKFALSAIKGTQKQVLKKQSKDSERIRSLKKNKAKFASEKKEIVKKKKDKKIKKIEKNKAQIKELKKIEPMKPISIEEKIDNKVINESQQTYAMDMDLLTKIVAEVIENNWKKPLGFDENLECQFVFRISNDGQTIDVITEKSSGVLAYDIEARACILKSKFPKLVWGREISLSLR